MQFNAGFPFFASAVIALLLYALLRTNLRGLSLGWDVIVCAAIFTGLSVAIVFER